MQKQSEGRVDEETPLLRPDDDSHDGVRTQSSVTPLPWAQFSIVLFLQLAEPLTSQVIYPFVPQLIREIGITDGDDTKVGYYVGIMQSIFFATQALTVLHWSRVSDRIGRKPVILVGLFGLSVSMYCFGLSRSFWELVISRSLAGALNGNIGVIKSILGELTDETNVARAFAYQPIPWSSGSTIGPMIGGALSRPAERFPEVFGNSTFLKTYPYFLPCAIPATFSLVAWIVTYLYLKETNPTGYTFRNIFKVKQRSKREMINKQALLADELNSPPLTSLLTPPVVLSGGAYALLSLIDIAYRALQPVFYATPRSLGGLGLEPQHIGTALAMLGFANGVFQVAWFAPIIKSIGLKRTYLLGIASAAPIFMFFPAMSFIVRAGWDRQRGKDGLLGLEEEQDGELTWLIIVAVGAQLALTLLLNMCYGCVFMYINSSAPSKRTLGAVNGLAQMVVSVMRCIGPAVASSLYSRCLQWQYEEGGGLLAGWTVYGLMLLLVGFSLVVGTRLPDGSWAREEC